MRFECIASKCKHNCCIGWEIDIDDATYEKYMSIEGDFGQRLKDGIIQNADGTHSFKLVENDRCFFLNENNLCDIILNLSEEYLSDICTEHPRFYVEDENGETVMGYGLCCEEAGRQQLFGDEPVSDIAKALCKQYASLSDFDIDAVSDFAGFLLTLEQLSLKWGEWLNRLLDSDIRVVMEKSLKLPLNGPYYHLMDYLLLRYANELYATVMWEFLRILYASLFGKCVNEKDLIELCRVYSSEIEYSDENVSKIMNYMEEEMSWQ